MEKSKKKLQQKGLRQLPCLEELKSSLGVTTKEVARGLSLPSPCKRRLKVTTVYSKKYFKNFITSNKSLFSVLAGETMPLAFDLDAKVSVLNLLG